MRKRIITAEKVISLAAVLSITAGLAGCGASSGTSASGSEAASSSASAINSVSQSVSGDQSASGAGASASTENVSGSSSDGEKTTIVCSTAGTVRPFTYTNDDGELVGYDVDLLKAIFEKLPQYDLQFKTAEFTALTAGLDSGIYQISACNWSYTEEREEKYTFTEPTFQNQFVIAVPEDNDTIKSWDDLAGKTTEVSPGLQYAVALEKWNEANPDKAVKLNYSQSDLTTMLSNVESGKYDFQLIDRTTLNAYLSDYGLKLKAVELPQDEADNISSNPYAYYLLPKTEEGEALAKEINQAFEEVVADGTALKISEQYLNGDYLPKEVEEKAGTGSAESVSGSSAVSSS